MTSAGKIRSFSRLIAKQFLFNVLGIIILASESNYKIRNSSSLTIKLTDHYLKEGLECSRLHVTVRLLLVPMSEGK